MAKLYGGQDPRNLPAYTAAEVARYLKLSPSTLGYWLRDEHPVIVRPDPEARELSFTNLVEAHVLSSIRHRGVPLQRIRAALDYLRETLGIADHPLARLDLQTDGVDLFVEWLGALINLSQGGQNEMKRVISAYLERVERDETGLANRLFPFTRTGQLSQQPRIVVIDPRVSFGRPTIVGAGIPTDVLADRYVAGDSMEQLAADYGCELGKIEEAIRCEFRAAA